MSLEENVKELTNAVQDLANVISKQTENIRATDALTSARPEVVEPEKEEVTTKYGIDALRNYAGTLVKSDPTNGYDTALKILNEFGKARFDELDSKDYDAAAKKFEAAIKKSKKKGKPPLG